MARTNTGSLGFNDHGWLARFESHDIRDCGWLATTKSLGDIHELENVAR